MHVIEFSTKEKITKLKLIPPKRLLPDESKRPTIRFENLSDKGSLGRL